MLAKCARLSPRFALAEMRGNSAKILHMQNFNWEEVDQRTRPHCSPLITFSRGMAKKSKNKVVDKIVENLIDDDDDELEVVDIQNSQLNKFLSSKAPGGAAKKGAKGNVQKMSYSDFTEIVKGERLWSDLNKTVEQLRSFYIQQLTVRSVTSLDELEIELEGDIFPLNELANISKKDPKRLIIDSSAFPQATKNIMEAIRDSGMNLNPQQDGFSIFVPIPKVTKEHRENLVNGAKKKMNESKNEVRRVQNKFSKIVGEDELADKVTKDDAKSAQETIKLIAEYFQGQAEQMLASKTKELLGK